MKQTQYVDINVNKWITKKVVKAFILKNNCPCFHIISMPVFKLSTSNQQAVDNLEIIKLCVYPCG